MVGLSLEASVSEFRDRGLGLRDEGSRVLFQRLRG